MNKNDVRVRIIFVKSAKRLRECARSRIAWLFVLLHATWFLLAVANMSPPSSGLAKFLESGGWSSATVFAGRPFHFHYESLALKLLVLCDLPSYFASAVLSLVTVAPILLFLRMFHFHLTFYAGSYVTAGLLLVVASVQWLMIGKGIHDWLQRRNWGKSFVAVTSRHFMVLVILICVFTSVATPYVNERSRRMGIRYDSVPFH